MSGVNPVVIFYVNQLAAVFRDDLGNDKRILGTGFWVTHEGKTHFVTNKHNVDAKLKLGEDTTFKLEGLKVRVRMNLGGQWYLLSELREVSNIKDVDLHPTADVAVFRSPIFAPLQTQVDAAGQALEKMLTPVYGLPSSDLADEAFFSNELAPMDTASFIGFPGLPGAPWYDELWNLAIARTTNIASIPGIPFNNNSIKTADTVLVSGLSFAGSSGSPVVSHQKGLKTGPNSGLTGPYTPPKVVGIMSGHWWNDAADKSTLGHSGLSYFTRSTSILQLLARLSDQNTGQHEHPQENPTLAS